jgi:hypothetical protein
VSCFCFNWDGEEYSFLTDASCNSPGQNEQKRALSAATKVYRQKNVFDPVVGRYCDETQEQRFQTYVLHDITRLLSPVVANAEI